MNISAEGSSNTSIESIAIHVSTVSMDSLFTQPVLHAYTVRKLSRTNRSTDKYDMQAQLNTRPNLVPCKQQENPYIYSAA